MNQGGRKKNSKEIGWQGRRGKWKKGVSGNRWKVNGGPVDKGNLGKEPMGSKAEIKRRKYEGKNH